MSGPLGFLVSNTHLATRNPKFQTEIEPECGKDLFLGGEGLHLNLGAKFQTEIELLSLSKLHKNFIKSKLHKKAKFQTEIELLSLSKLHKNISPPRNLL